MITEEQYNEIKPWLDKHGISLTIGEVSELVSRVGILLDGNNVCIKMDDNSLFLDHNHIDDVARGLLAVCLNEHDKGAEALSEMIMSVAGHLVARKDDVIGELETFCEYAVKVANDIGNKDGLSGFNERSTSRMVFPVQNNKIKS